jgi:heptosyltransferase II
MQKILVIQTAFIGDVVLATGLIEKLHTQYPETSLDILVRKGNESLFIQHPFIHEVLVWDKKKNKYPHFFEVLKKIRANRYDILINIQRFAATGLLTVLSKAKRTIGFDKNPFSFLFSEAIPHLVRDSTHPMHEIDRNHQLIRGFTDEIAAKPKLYPSQENEKAVIQWKQDNYICIAPASVWFTKQFPMDQWVRLIDVLPTQLTIYLLGAPDDHALCENIKLTTTHDSVENLAGKLNFLESAALMTDAVMNYVNDSAPMHFASAVNAPVTAVYCSTVPAFGFGPLSDIQHIVETGLPLSCRPCGLHGKRVCPLTHFNCAKQITTEQLLAVLPV